MRGEKYYIMSQKQLNRFHVLSMVIDKKMTNSEAAESLGLSVRQIIRLKKGVMNKGFSCLIHNNKGRKSAHGFSDDFIENVVSLKKSDIYLNANFLHFQELLQEHEKISISYSALHNLLSSAGFISPKKHRRVKTHHRRKRKPKEGLLIQMDATPHDWFQTGQNYSLHGAIDDATGKIVGLYMSKNECRQGYFETVIPVSLYTDRHSIFLSPKADKLSIEDQLKGKIINDTQFGRAMKELGITIIMARSSQAKEYTPYCTSFQLNDKSCC